MHDMWGITGGCHQSFSCRGYLTGCSNCPVFEGVQNAALPEKEFKAKLGFYSKYDNISFIANSKWLFSCTRQSLLTNKNRVFYLPDITDTAIFKSFDKQAARSALNIGADEKVIIFETYTINTAYGGFDYFERSLEILQQQEAYKNICVLIIGDSSLKTDTASLKIKTRVIGYLYDEYSKALVYNAADVFVMTSVVDEGAMLIQECLSCGLPAVTFDMAGMQDIITHKKNGYIARYKDVTDLEEGIRFCLNSIHINEVTPKFTDDQIINRHLKILNSVSKKVNSKKISESGMSIPYQIND
jgi:glycosyltransferase involved in cell wall biosynthesis